MSTGETSAGQKCQRCAAPLPSRSPRPFCPACILESTSLTGHDRIGPYLIDSLLGEGGMGEVFLAFHDTTGRAVALKIPRISSRPSRDSLFKRFAKEARVLSLLDHPGILPIYEVGEADGRPWFAMKLAEGGTLADHLHEHGPLPPRQTAELLATIASAVQFAHDHGILHRDLKPQNILLDESGTPMLGDFGLARDTEHPLDFSRTIAALGTPGYSAPEVSRGRAPAAAADIFSLGAIMYHVLAGTSPFRSETLSSTLELAQLGKAQPLTRRGIPVDLWRICSKCLEPEPADRYDSAAVLEADLRAWLDGRHISVRRTTPLIKLSRLIRRNPLITALILTTALAIIVSLSIMLVSHQRVIQAARIRTEAEQQLATERMHRERLHHIKLLLEANKAGHRREALAWLREAWSQQPSDAIRSLAIRALSKGDFTLADGQVPPVQHAYAKMIKPRESVSATGHKAIVSGALGNLLQLFNPSGELETTLSVEDAITALQWDSSGNQLAIGCISKNTYLWRVGEPPLQRHIRSRDSSTHHFSWHPNGRFIACVTADGALYLWDVERRQDIVMHEFGISEGVKLSWDADGKGLSWADARGQQQHIRVTFPIGVRQLCQDDSRGRRENFCTVDLDSKRGLALWTTEAGVRLWDLTQGTNQLLATRSGNEWLGARFSEKGVLTCGWNSGLRDFSLAQWQQGELPPIEDNPSIGTVLLDRSPNPPHQLAHLANPQNRFLLFSEGGQRVSKALPQPNPYSVALSADGHLAATSSFRDPIIRVWKLSEAKPPVQWPAEEIASTLRFSPDSKTLLTASARLVTLWDAASGAKKLTIHGADGPIHMASWSPDGRIIAILSPTGALLYRAHDGALLARLASPVPQSGNAHVALSFDTHQPWLGEQLEDGTLIVWDLDQLTHALQDLGIDWPLE